LAALRLVRLGVRRAHEQLRQPGKHHSKDCQDDEHLDQREAVLGGPESMQPCPSTASGSVRWC
jgi:hypothetical protein